MHDLNDRYRSPLNRRQSAALARRPASWASTAGLPDVPLPLLVTGMAGVPGFNAFFAYRERFGDQVVGIRPRNNWPLSGPGIVACDLEDHRAVRELVRRYRFRSVLSCGGSCALKNCELDPAMARRINVDGVANLLDGLDNEPNRLVHLSIDLVFSGKGPGGYREDDPVDPVTVYGRTMAEAEELVLRRRPDACVLRISLPMGISFNGHAGAIDWIQSRFARGKPATLYFDEIRTPAYVECLTRLYARLLSGDLAGLYHAGGPCAMSLYEIAQVVNRIGGYDPRLLQGCPRAAAGPVPPRAGNVTLCSDKLAAALGGDPLAPWPFCDRHRPTGRNWHFERQQDDGAGRQLLHDVLYNLPSGW